MVAARDEVEVEEVNAPAQTLAAKWDAAWRSHVEHLRSTYRILCFSHGTSHHANSVVHIFTSITVEALLCL